MCRRSCAGLLSSQMCSDEGTAPQRNQTASWLTHMPLTSKAGSCLSWSPSSPERFVTYHQP